MRTELIFSPSLQYADQSLMKSAIKTSEESWIEQQMLEDKKRATDWEATNEAIEEQVARESYLQWLRDQEKQARQVSTAGANIQKPVASTEELLQLSTRFRLCNVGMWFEMKNERCRKLASCLNLEEFS